VKLRIDKDIYLRIAEDAVVESDEVAPGAILDFDVDNSVVGIEILDFSKRHRHGLSNKIEIETT
jgi:uncharacterized protein YuzE